MPVPVLRHLPGRQDYGPVFDAMRRFNDARDTDTADEIWVLEHAPVYTLGLGARDGHVHAPGSIPVVRSDRGGQVTYHGPGQLIVYLLLDLRRAGLGIRPLVQGMEQAVLDLLSDQDIAAGRRPGAPGVYVEGAKLAALGVRVRRGGCYHGLALNVDMDLSPFAAIDPCGYAGLPVTRLRDLGLSWTVAEAATRLLPYLCRQLRLPDPVASTPPRVYPSQPDATWQQEQSIGQ